MQIDGHTHLLNPDSPFSEHMNGDPALLLRMLDEAEIDKAVVFAVAPYVNNRFIIDSCRAHPDRLIGFASVDPNALALGKPNLAVEKLQRLLSEYPFRGLKLHPRLQGFQISSGQHLPLFQEAARLDLPVLIDCISQPSSLVPLADNLPFQIDRLIRMVPGLKVIMAHMGGHRVLDAYCVALSHSDVYLDLSWILHLYEGSSVEQDIRFVVKKLAPLNRVIFGSDFPIFNRENTLPIRYSKRLCLDMFAELNLEQPQIDAIMGGTMLRLIEEGR